MSVVAVKSFRASSRAALYQPGQVISPKDSSSGLLLTAWVAQGLARDTNAQGTQKRGRRLSPPAVHPLHAARGTAPSRLSAAQTVAPVPTTKPAATTLAAKK
jgi:hypothetical protein